MADSQSPCEKLTAYAAAAYAAASKPPSSRGRRKWKKPKDKPKPPLSAYDIFVQQQIICWQAKKSSLSSDSSHQSINNNHNNNSSSSCDEMDDADARVHVSVMWRSLDDETRTVYEAEAKKDQQRFAQEIEEWQNRKFQLGEQDQRDGLGSPAALAFAVTSDERIIGANAAAAPLLGPNTSNLWNSTNEETTRCSKEQYTIGIDEWRKRKFQCGTDIDDHRVMISSALSSMEQLEGYNTVEQYHHRPIERNSTVWESMPVEACMPSYNMSSYNSESYAATNGSALPPRGNRPNPPMIQSLPPAAQQPLRIPGSSGMALALASSSARRNLSPEQVDKYVRPENLTHLVAQLETEEVEFLASLRHAR